MTLSLTQKLASSIDPRRSMVSAVVWLVFALSISLALVASYWVNDLVGTSLLTQSTVQLDNNAESIASNLSFNLSLRLQSVRAMALLLAINAQDESPTAVRAILRKVQNASPEFDWIGFASPKGVILASTNGAVEGANVAKRSWFSLGLKNPKIGVVKLSPALKDMQPDQSDTVSDTHLELTAPVLDEHGDTIGIIGIRMSQRWLLDLAGSLRGERMRNTGTESLILTENEDVLIGPENLKNRRWSSAVQSATAAPKVDTDEKASETRSTSFITRLADGKTYLVAQVTPSAADAWNALGWRVLALQPMQEIAQRARSLQFKISIILICLGLIAALLGAQAARRITKGLLVMAHSADDIRSGMTQGIEVPSGSNEVARLGRAFNELLASLQRERNALLTLNSELDQRVAERTLEIRRLGQEARHAAVVRERLKIARDLHDTLAHSMMAMLTEIRLLKRLSTTDPRALAEEFLRAEEAAHQGIKEARAAIAQMRYNPVRDGGLAEALEQYVKRFAERTGIAVQFTNDLHAGALTDERGEALFRMAEEAMHNIERHAQATQVTVSLSVTGEGHETMLTVADNGIGFDMGASHPGHYGLSGLQEQAQLIGAALTIQSAVGHGTTIGIVVPPR